MGRRGRARAVDVDTETKAAMATVDTVEHADSRQIRLAGDWTLATMPSPIAAFERRLCELRGSNVEWDLRSISRLDSAGAIVLWRAWGR